ncbi:hypothetical protein NUH30_18785 [Leptospira sp. 85282-16]|uniref:hypothetical protein n=1 Tax=Leptospira sp. 85282-16 TaxID=2971256 RepID=UPI0021BFD7DD|nr:hypothetical protein [Leptospira sp. 85282-16]MCT8335739.1 hypothetical protein [Leptospira sp. 85282-16]
MLRLFLSVDIQGSTNLKNKLNYSTLNDDFVEKCNLILHLIKQDLITCPANIDEITYSEKLALESIATNIQERKHIDWLEAQSNLFQDFNSNFFANLTRNYNPNLNAFDLEKFLWKSIGDELVYVFEVNTRDNIHNICLSFLATLYLLDQKFSQANYYRLKASAWTAGFPIRNREIKFPFPQSFTRIENDEGEFNYDKYDYPRRDFIGPDIDIGFRIGKFCWPGVLTVSMDLAELLSENRKSKLTVRFVGWENLKGVWNNIHYPIFWVTMDRSLIESQGLKEYKFYNSSDIALSKNLENFDAGGAEGYVDITTQRISEIRKELPSFLGLVKPYLEDDTDPVPLEHAKIKELLLKLEDFKKAKKHQLETENKELESRDDNFETEIDQKIGNKFNSPPSIP